MPRALLLDDLQMEAAILKTILSAAGFNVYISSFATMTGLPVEDGSFDIAILDLSVDTAEALQILELCKALAGTAILVMTDNATIEHALRVSALTITAEYIKKPFSKDEFLTAVGRAIERAQVLRENRALKHQEATTTPRHSQR